MQIVALTALLGAASAQAETNFAPLSVTKLPAPEPIGKISGRTIATEGEWLAVGNPHGEIPSVFVYRQVDGAWTFYQELHASDQGMPDAAEHFGSSVAFDASLMAVGGWVPEAECSTVLGCLPVDNNGGVYVFLLEDDGRSGPRSDQG